MFGYVLVNCHVFMYSWKRSPRDCVLKLRGNQIFKALLWIKKSFKSFDFDLAKYTLVFNVKSSLEFVWKDSSLKIKMSLLGSRSSTNIQIRNIFPNFRILCRILIKYFLKETLNVSLKIWMPYKNFNVNTKI